MDASDLIRALPKNLARRGPSTYGKRPFAQGAVFTVQKCYNLNCHFEVFSFPSVGTDPELKHRAWGAASLIRASRFHLLASAWDTP